MTISSSPDARRVIDLYEERFARLGYSPQTLGWNSREDQRLRFELLAGIGLRAGCSVCDVGCGFADFHDYLGETVGPVDYTGFDLCPSLVREARRRHPECRLECRDILDHPPREQFDYVVLSGALNLRLPDNWGTTCGMLRAMFALARHGVAANFLTTHVNFQRPHNYHHDPARLFGFAQQLTRWVELRHAYPLWEFTIYLYHEPSPAVRTRDQEDQA